ncbi:phospho-sugar mutase [Salibacteraceae bacterium]|nr:phospho-sugar mutase [Salibacteraceae bacterium]
MTAKETAENWINQNLDENSKFEIKQLLDGDASLLEDAFHKNLEFGTGGMRGVMGIGSNRVNRYTLGMATQGLSNYLNKQFADQAIKVVIAYDCRNNSKEFGQLVADIFSANGIHAYLFSALRPTPELSFAVRHLGCQSGIVITASHNPPEYNGYKVYWEDGAQIVHPHDAGIIGEVNAIQSLDQIKFDSNAENITFIESEIDKAFIQTSIEQRKTTKSNPLKIVFTSLHGTSITVMPELLNQAGYTDVHIVEEQAIPDGNFPTVESPNPEERAALDLALKKADAISADMVVGTDPDSDRLGVAIRNDKGEMQLLNGNQCGVLLTDYLLDKTELKGNEFIAYTIVSSELFGDVAKHYNVDSEVCLTGFKHIASLIRNNEGLKKFIGGGEESYGYMIGDFVRDKDALTSTLLFCDMAAELKANGSSAFERLCSIYERHGLYTEHLISITKKGIHGAREISAIMDRLRSESPKTLAGETVCQVDDIKVGTSRDLITGKQSTLDLPTSNVLQFYTESGSKISARPSGTEPKIKFYFSLRADWNPSLNYMAQEKILNDKIELIIEDLNL